MAVWVYIEKKCLSCGKVEIGCYRHPTARKKSDINEGVDKDVGGWTGHPSSCCMAATERLFKGIEPPEGTLLVWRPEA